MLLTKMDSAASTLRGQTLPAGVMAVEGEIADCRHRLAGFVRLLTAGLEDRRRIADEWRRWEEGTAAIVLWFETTGETLKTCLCQAGSYANHDSVTSDIEKVKLEVDLKKSELD